MVEKRIVVAALAFVIALTAVIALTVRVFGVEVPDCVVDVRTFKQGTVVEKAPKRYAIHYVARMWKFDPPEVALAPGSTADIYLSTPDVVHGAQIVGTNFNLTAVPGAVNYARVQFDKEGDYLVVCNEYCGTSHQNMAGVIHVSAKAAAPPPPPPAADLPGRALIDNNGCTGCHSIDGSVESATTFKGLYGSTRVLRDGSKVVADDAYLRESIEKPDAKIVKGFEAGAMPQMPLSPAEVQSIIDYLKTLK